MSNDEIIIEFWKTWTENPDGLDFEAWLDKHGKAEAEKLMEDVFKK